MDSENAYNRALDYLYSFVDYSLKHASELAKADFNLDRMRALMALLGDPQEKVPIIHVAGTKGKGSTSAMCASAVGSAGYRTGLYTSPHLQDYCERIQVAGEQIPHADLADLVDEIKPAVAQIPFLTTFEITTALGFLYFARREVDAAVIEVGLGGRLDATNIITPAVSVITSLSYDHMAVLGNTLALIAGEKAGIIKPDVPVVSSPQREEALQVLTRIAEERGSALTLVGRDVLFAAGERSLEGQSLRVWTHGSHPCDLTIPLLGTPQVENAATAYATLLQLRVDGWDIPTGAIQAGFARVSWPGRFEVLRREPALVLDSAHNIDSAEKLVQSLETYFPGRMVILIFGASEDKDVTGMLSVWKPCLSRVIVTHADHPRALAPEKLAAITADLGIPVEAVANVPAALERGLELSQKDGSIVLSAGSMFVTAEVRTAWQRRNPAGVPGLRKENE
ncbi:MAG: folylpolyglutamate synthase/dihydrofolate synthase family protein [Chloroflexota bacterium]